METQSYQNLLLKNLDAILGNVNLIAISEEFKKIQKEIDFEKQPIKKTPKKSQILKDLEEIIGKIGVSDLYLIGGLVQNCKGSDYFADLGYVCDMLWILVIEQKV